MRNTIVLTKRELGGYFATPIGYVILCVWLLICGFLTFYVGGFFPDDPSRGQASLGASFFQLHPWIFILIMPAISMRLWAEERRQGTIELLRTLPVTLPQLVTSKFLAAWIFAGVALALTFPMWITVAWLGDPDHGVIVASYLGSWLMAGAYLALGACLSATTKNQVIALVIGVLLNSLLLFIGIPAVKGMLQSVLRNDTLASALGSFSFLTRFESITRGVVDVRDVFFFGSLIACFLFVNAIIIELRKAS